MILIDLLFLLSTVLDFKIEIFRICNFIFWINFYSKNTNYTWTVDGRIVNLTNPNSALCYGNQPSLRAIVPLSSVLGIILHFLISASIIVSPLTSLRISRLSQLVCILKKLTINRKWCPRLRRKAFNTSWLPTLVSSPYLLLLPPPPPPHTLISSFPLCLPAIPMHLHTLLFRGVRKLFRVGPTPSWVPPRDSPNPPIPSSILRSSIRRARTRLKLMLERGWEVRV